MDDGGSDPFSEPDIEPVPEQIDVTVDVDGIELLTTQQFIAFGRVVGLEMVSSRIPANYKPTTPKGDMYADFIPTFMAEKSLSWDDAHRNIVDFEQPRTPGLFWSDGWGFCHRALLWAIAMAHTYAARASNISRGNVVDLYGDCNFTPAAFRQAVNRNELHLHIINGNGANGSITHHADGNVESQRDPSSWVGFTYVGRIRLQSTIRLQAALADYYFWWAWRLHSWCAEGRGTMLDAWVGWCAAHAALAEILDLAALIIHEWCHLAGPSQHCSNRFTRFGCCHFFLEWIFKNRVMAHLALPRSHHQDFFVGQGPVWAQWTPFTVGTIPDYDRFDYFGGFRMAYAGGTQFGDKSGCERSWARFYHGNVFDEDHSLSMDFFMHHRCVDAGGRAPGDGLEGTETF